MIQKKICMLGASGVGKTSLVKQYVEGIFSEKYLTSIGVKIDKKQIETAKHTVQLMIWDIEGIDRYCGFQAKYLRGASAFIIVTDHTRSQVNEIKQNFNGFFNTSAKTGDGVEAMFAHLANILTE